MLCHLQNKHDTYPDFEDYRLFVGHGGFYQEFKESLVYTLRPHFKQAKQQETKPTIRDCHSKTHFKQSLYIKVDTLPYVENAPRKDAHKRKTLLYFRKDYGLLASLLSIHYIVLLIQ